MNKIRIEDLSVGDWVILESFSNYPMKVDYILPNGLVGVADGRDGIETYPDELSAVLITPEILENNGFERAAVGGVIYHHCSYAEISLYKDGWWHTVNLDEYSINKINGVHQLQHLLRLYGSEKEIVL